MKDIKKHYQWLQLFLNVLGIGFLLMAFQQDILPSFFLVYLMIAHLLLFGIQWFKKIPITLVFILIICWTLICIKHWPTIGIIHDLGWTDYVASLASLSMALSGWLMHTYNNQRW